MTPTADLNQTALAAAKEVRGIASTEGIIRARLPRLTDDMMRAAARAHFASDNIDGIGMTANGIDYSFRQAFTRMWSGIRRSRGGNNAE